MRLLFRRDLVCQQAVELVTDYLDGTLSRLARTISASPCHATSSSTCSAAGSPSSSKPAGAGSLRYRGADGGVRLMIVLQPSIAATGIRVSWGSW